MKHIRSTTTSITKLEINLVNEAIKYGWKNKMNYYIDKFSDKFSQYIGVKYVLPVSHCTSAIHLALRVLDIKKGDEVIVPDITWVASASPVLYVGAKPVFCDVDRETFCINLESIKKRISKKTKAIIGVDLIGNIPQWKEIIKFCKKNKIYVIEDAAEGIGAKYNKKNAGNFGDISLFSFNATKLIMSGQGGAFCTNNKKLYIKAKMLAEHGIDQEKSGKYYWSNDLGYNYRWTNIQAALALAQLSRIEELLDFKQSLFNSYYKELNNVEELRFIKHSPNVDPSYWINALIFIQKTNYKKEKVCQYFQKKKIDLRPFFYQLSEMPTFKKFSQKKNFKNLNSHELATYGIMLPYGYDLNSKDISRICNMLKKYIKKNE